MPNDQLHRLAIDLLESGLARPAQLRDQVESAIRRMAARLEDDDEIRYAWSTGNDTELVWHDSVDAALAAEHEPHARLIGCDERGGLAFDVDEYGMGNDTTVRLRIRRANLAAVEIPIEDLERPRDAFLVAVAAGVYRLGGRALRPVEPVSFDVVRPAAASSGRQAA
jgi:hypothetical protein